MFYRPTPSSDWLAGSRWWGGIEEGLSLRAAAAALSVSPATAHRWWQRWLDGGRRPEALVDRSSRPLRSPWLLAAELQERICACRRQTGWGPRLVAGATASGAQTRSRSKSCDSSARSVVHARRFPERECCRALCAIRDHAYNG
jgi:hypothetical protein